MKQFEEKSPNPFLVQGNSAWFTDKEHIEKFSYTFCIGKWIDSKPLEQHPQITKQLDIVDSKFTTPRQKLIECFRNLIHSIKTQCAKEECEEQNFKKKYNENTCKKGKEHTIYYPVNFLLTLLKQHTPVHRHTSLNELCKLLLAEITQEKKNILQNGKKSKVLPQKSHNTSQNTSQRKMSLFFICNPKNTSPIEENPTQKEDLLPKRPLSNRISSAGMYAVSGDSNKKRKLQQTPGRTPRYPN